MTAIYKALDDLKKAVRLTYIDQDGVVCAYEIDGTGQAIYDAIVALVVKRKEKEIADG